MKLSGERSNSSSKRQIMLCAGFISLCIFLISFLGPIESHSQNVPPFSNQTLPTSTATSERLGPPLIISGAPGQGASAGQQQQYSVYENPEHGFSIEYPSDWSLRQEGRAGVIATFSTPLETNFDPFAANLVIGVDNLTSGASLENYTRTVVVLLRSQPPGADFNLTDSPVATNFGGLPAHRIGFTMTVPNDRSLSSETNVEGIQVWTLDNDTAYVLSFAAEQNKFASYLPIINHIIDSFRLTSTEG